MNFQYQTHFFTAGEVLEVTCDRTMNVRLMDSWNFSRFRQNQSATFYGGSTLRSPARLQPPYPGMWYVVVDLGGYSGHVNYSLRFLQVA